MFAKLAIDENLKAAIVRGLLRRQPKLDLIDVRDVGLDGLSDPVILEWAAQESRVLLTHDVNTITKFAYDRLAAELPMSGVMAIQQNVSIGQAVEDILLLAEFEEECWGQVRYIPF